MNRARSEELLGVALPDPNIYARVLIIETEATTPHFETSLEIAQQFIDEGSAVTYDFVGDAVPFRQFTPSHDEFRRRRCREAILKGIGLVDGERFHGRFVDAIEDEVSVPAIPETQEELRRVMIAGFPLGLSSTSSLISKLRNPYFTPRDPDIEPLLQDAMLSGALLYEYTCRRIAETRADLVVAFNGRFVHSSAIHHAAVDADVAWALHERSVDEDCFTLRLRSTPHGLGDEMLVRSWNQEQQNPLRLVRARRRALEGLSAAHAHASERGYWDHWSDDVRLPEGVEKWAAYFNSSLSEYAAVAESRFAPWESEIAAVEALVDQAELAGWGVVLRLHPNLQNMHPTETDAWQDRFGGRRSVLVVSPEDPLSSYALLRRIDLVATGWSTIGREAALAGLPVVCVAQSEWQIALGLLRATDVDDFRMVLSRPPEAIPLDDALVAFHRPLEEACLRFQYFVPTALKEGRFKGVDLDPKGRRRKPRSRKFDRARRAASRIGSFSKRFS